MPLTRAKKMSRRIFGIENPEYPPTMLVAMEIILFDGDNSLKKGGWATGISMVHRFMDWLYDAQ